MMSIQFNSYFKEIIDLIIYDAMEYKLPGRGGSLRVRKYKPSILTKDGKLNAALAMDYQKSIELWNKEYPNFLLR